MEPKKEELLCLLEERLVQHDNSRKEVQNQLQEICTKITGEANLLEEKINGELQQSFSSVEERFLNLVEKLNNQENEENDNGNLIKQVQKELSTEVKYEIQHVRGTTNFSDSYKLKTKIMNNKNKFNNTNDIKTIINEIHSHLNRIHESMTAAQDRLTEICTKERNRAGDLEKRINEKMERYFAQEDARLQKAMKILKEDTGEDKEKLISQMKEALIIKQKYVLHNSSPSKDHSFDDYDVTVVKEAFLKITNFEAKKPVNISTSCVNKKRNGNFFHSFQ